MRFFFLIALSAALSFSLGAQQISSSASLTSFNAVPREKQVLLSWNPDQTGVKEYQLEKSKNGADFVPFGKVQGAEAETEFLETDFSPFDGLSYYRLRLVSGDGAVSYSNVVPVKYENGNAVSPLGGATYFPNEKNRSVLVVVRNASGDEYYSKVDVQSAGDPVECKDPEPLLAMGTYTIVACSEQELYSKQLEVK